MEALTKEELRNKLASKENKLAGKLIKLISSNDSDKLSKASKLLSLGCPDIFYKRDPSHPRSRYRVENVLDSCFSCFDTAPTFSQAGANLDGEFKTQEDTNHDGIAKIFRLLIQNGFKAGNSSFKGCHANHILNNIFYKTNPNKTNEISKKNLSLRLGKILVEEKVIDINYYAGNSYLWVNSLENLENIIWLGAETQGNNLIDCAISYVSCADDFNQSPTPRVEVIKKLLQLKAIARKPLEMRIGVDGIKSKLREHGLLHQIQYQISSHQLKDLIRVL